MSRIRAFRRSRHFVKKKKKTRSCRRAVEAELDVPSAFRRRVVRHTVLTFSHCNYPCVCRDVSKVMTYTRETATICVPFILRVAMGADQNRNAAEQGSANVIREETLDRDGAALRAVTPALTRRRRSSVSGPFRSAVPLRREVYAPSAIAVAVGILAVQVDGRVGWFASVRAATRPAHRPSVYDGLSVAVLPGSRSWQNPSARPQRLQSGAGSVYRNRDHPYLGVCGGSRRARLRRAGAVQVDGARSGRSSCAGRAPDSSPVTRYFGAAAGRHGVQHWRRGRRGSGRPRRRV